MTADNPAPQDAEDSRPRVGQASPDFVEALARGLRVLEAFNLPAAGDHRRGMTLTDVARLTDLTRGTARRLLLTLKALNYVGSDGKHFWLTPRVLQLSEGLRVPLGLGDRATALLHRLTEKLDESASVGILDGENIVYVERVEVRRIYSSRIVSGTRLPAQCSSIGRVLLAALPAQRLELWLDSHPLRPLTPRTIVDRQAFMAELGRVRAQGFALIDEELEIGIRSIAVPIVGASGRTVAALNASTSTARHTVDDLRDRFLPELRTTAQDLAKDMDW